MEKTEDGFGGHLRISSGVMRMPTCSRGQQFVHMFLCLSILGKCVLGEKWTHIPSPTVRNLQPVSVCSDKIFVIIVSAPLRCWAVLAVLCVLAVPSPPSTLFLIWGVIQRKVHYCPSTWRCTGTTCACCRGARCRSSCLACTAVCWGVAIRLRNAWNERSEKYLNLWAISFR